MKTPEVVSIGGGSGTPIINEALIRAGVPFVRSVVTVMDSGGITGRMRTDSRGAEIAYSDGLRTLLSLIPTDLENDNRVLALKDLLRRRNDRGQDLGYTIFSHYFHQKDGFAEVKTLLENLTGIEFLGDVLPVTLRSTNITFATLSGQHYFGEHELDNRRLSADMVKGIKLSPPVPASQTAIEAIASADVLILSCGSFYGSLLVNFLPQGVKEALKKSHSKRILVTNLASTRNETHEFRPEDFINRLRSYTGLSKPVDVMVVPNLSQKTFEKAHPRVAAQYALEHSHFLGWEDDVLAPLEESGVTVIRHDATLIDPVHNRLRHDPKALARSFSEILS